MKNHILKMENKMQTTQKPNFMDLTRGYEPQLFLEDTMNRMKTIPPNVHKLYDIIKTEPTYKTYKTYIEVLEEVNQMIECRKRELTYQKNTEEVKFVIFPDSFDIENGDLTKVMKWDRERKKNKNIPDDVECWILFPKLSLDLQYYSNITLKLTQEIVIKENLPEVATLLEITEEEESILPPELIYLIANIFYKIHCEDIKYELARFYILYYSNWATIDILKYEFEY